MIQLSLTLEEAMELREVLRLYVSDLRMEIADTEAMGLREELKEQEAFLKRLIARLSAGEATA